jgi:hypothetical protein
MFCDEALDAVEAIAAGERIPAGRVGQHLASCRQCAAALESARRVEELLRARELPKPSSNFTARTMTRVRRARWRSERVLDTGFNLALTLVITGIAGAVWVLMNRTGLVSLSSGAVQLFGSGVMTLVHRVAPSLPLYGAATALVGSALIIWWWAERDATL